MNCPLYEGKVYALASKETEMIYIGSTTQTLKKRFGEHISNRKSGCQHMRQCSSNEIVKYPDCDIYLLDRLYVTQSKSDLELLKLEGEYQLINKDICVNKVINRGMTPPEYMKFRAIDPVFSKKDVIRKKKWQDQNKEYVKQMNHFRKTSFFGQLCKMYKIYN